MPRVMYSPASKGVLVGGGNQAEQIKIGIGCPVDHFLTGRGIMGQFGHDGVFGATADQVSQFFLFAAEKKPGDPFPAGHHPDYHAGIFVPFHVMENHGGSVDGGGPLHGAACAHVPVDAGELGFRVDLHISFDQLSGEFREHRQRLPQTGH